MVDKKMLSFKKCKSIALERLAVLVPGAALYDEPVHTGDYGWVFSWQSKKYMRTSDIQDAFIGNPPILVDKNKCDALILGSGLPTEYYVENYLACGDPFKFLGKRIELSGWRKGAQKIEAIRAIRQTTGLSLADAKLHVDECLDRKIAVVNCPSVNSATALVNQLTALGFIGKQLRD